MPAKQHAASKSTASQSGRTGLIGDALIAVGFPILCAAYLVLYLRSTLPETRGLMSRGQLLHVRTLLPEDAVADWFGTPFSFGLFDRWPVIGLATVILLVGWLTGRLLLRLVGFERRSSTAGDASPADLTRLERFLFASGVGLNTVSLYVLAIGLMGALQRWAVAIPAAAVVAANVWNMLRERRREPLDSGGGEVGPRPAVGGQPSSAMAAPGDDGISAKWLWLAVPFAVVILLGGMLPPLDFDVREYHLQAPKEFYQGGKIVFLPHNVYGNMPLGGEMFALLAMVLADDWWLGALVGKTVIALFAPLTALALLAAGRRFASAGAGAIAAVLYLSIPWVSVVSTSGLIEGVLAFYLFLAVYAVLLWRQLAAGDAAPRPKWGRSEACLALAGFCSGGAVSCKYPAVLFVAAPLFFYIAVSSGKRCWKPLTIFSIALATGCGLWFVKNWTLTGNPVYPLLYDWLGGATRSVEQNERWLRAHSPPDFSLASLANSLSALAWRSSWLSPLVVPLAALGLLVRRYRALAFVLAGYFAYIVAAWWLFTHRIDRFWIPALPLVALLAGLGAVWSVSLPWRRMVLTLIVVATAISFVYVTAPTSYNAYFVSLQAARQDTRRISPWHIFLNGEVPAGSKVLSVGDVKVFDLSVGVLYNTAFDKNLAAEVFEGRAPREIAAELHDRHISHVFVDWSEIDRYRKPGNYGGMPDFITPDWFEGLVAQGVLSAAWQNPFLPRQAVYPVP